MRKSALWPTSFLSLWHLLDDPTLKEPAVGVLDALHAVGTPGAPLLEEEGGTLPLHLVADVQHPLFLHRPGLGTALTSYYDPVDTVEVEITQILK